MKKIHPTAVVDKTARIADSVEVGPYCLIAPGVEIGEGSRLYGHVVIETGVMIGRRCSLYPGVTIGMEPQDKKYKGQRSHVTIGDDNVLREHVTIHRGSSEGAKTVIGDRNLFMVGSHVAHDCTVGSDVVIANASALAGHVKVEDKVMISAFVGVHQFVRVGKLAIIGALSKVVMDVPPFSICDGHPAAFTGLNAVGLRRAGFSSKDGVAIKKALKTLFGSGLNLSNAARKVAAEFKGNEHVNYLLSFSKASKRGISREI